MTAPRFTAGTRLRAGQLNALAGRADAAHLGAAGFLAQENGREQVARSPHRLHAPVRRERAPELFDIRTKYDPSGHDDGPFRILAYLPPDGIWTGRQGASGPAGSLWRGQGAYVTVGGSPAICDEENGQALGDKDAPWVDLGPVPTGGWRVWMRFRENGGTYFWRLSVLCEGDSEIFPDESLQTTVPAVLIAELPGKLHRQERRPSLRQIRSGLIEVSPRPLTDEDLVRAGASVNASLTQTIESMGGALRLRDAESGGRTDSQFLDGESVEAVPVLLKRSRDNHLAMRLFWLTPTAFISLLNLKTKDQA